VMVKCHKAMDLVTSIRRASEKPYVTLDKDG